LDGPSELDPDATAGDVAVAAMAAAVGTFLGHQADLRAGAGPESVHEARTALRRLRSHLRTFDGLFASGWAVELRDLPAWISDALGEARDADVLLARIERYAGDVPDDERADADALLERFRQAHGDAHARVRWMLEGQEFVATVAQVHDRLTSPPRSDKAQTAATSAMRDILERTYRRARARVRDAGSEPSDVELHAIRIRVKRLRYACEAFEAVTGKRARRYARRAADLQDVLGEQHDAVVARRALLAITGDGAATAARFAARAERDAVRARRGWRRKWERLADRRARFWRG
jgi:CHAD domain-containing protein